MAEHDGDVADPERPGGAHVFEVARAQELGAHHADEARSSEKKAISSVSSQKFMVKIAERMMMM